jgi:hypothetical protein
MPKKLFIIMTACFVAGIAANVVVALACSIVAQRHLVRSNLYKYLAGSRLTEELALCAVWTPNDQRLRDAFSTVQARSQIPVGDRFGYCEYHHAGEPVMDSSTGIPVFPTASLRTLHIEAGWPAKSLRHIHAYVATLTTEYSELQAGRLPGRAANNRVLPNKPIVGRFVLNTLFYTLIGLVLCATVTAPRQARRWLRRRRGLCPACGYPVGVNPVCTECGHRLALAGRGDSFSSA